MLVAGQSTTCRAACCSAGAEAEARTSFRRARRVRRIRSAHSDPWLARPHVRRWRGVWRIEGPWPCDSSNLVTANALRSLAHSLTLSPSHTHTFILHKRHSFFQVPPRVFFAVCSVLRLHNLLLALFAPLRLHPSSLSTPSASSRPVPVSSSSFTASSAYHQPHIPPPSRTAHSPLQHNASSLV